MKAVRAVARVARLYLAALAASTALTAQSISLGPQLILADYRETFSDLHYRGTGFGATLSASYKKAAVEVSYASVSYDPADDGSAVTPFKAAQFDARARYYLAGPASFEIGVTSRHVDPDFAAQAAGAARVGVRLSQVLDPPVRIHLRGSYLPAAKFSGGGTAAFGIELGLGVSGEVARGHVRLSADYEFQYFGRETDDGSGPTSVPIQQALLRFGVGATF